MKFPSVPLSARFYSAIGLIGLSFILGVFSKIWLVVYFQDESKRWISVGIYVLSWISLAIGLWWAGKEYADSVRKYATYQFYHQSLKDGTQKAIHKTKELQERVKGKIQTKRQSFYSGEGEKKV
ncbi:MAG: hypothetical protein AABX37_01330 [Nanoarchaeota archaeon]